MFGGRVSDEHRAHVTDWWVEVMGGPCAYTERHGGYEHMLARHRDLAITAEQRLAFVTLLSRAADDADLPADPGLRAAIMGYAEWGTRLAMHNSQPGTQTGAHAPVPRWGWGGRTAVRVACRRILNAAVPHRGPQSGWRACRLAGHQDAHLPCAESRESVRSHLTGAGRCPRRVVLLAICGTRAVSGRHLPLCSRVYVEAPFVACCPTATRALTSWLVEHELWRRSGAVGASCLDG
jgi:hemoglobin